VSDAEDIRCTAPHPAHTNRLCRAKLAVVVPGTVDVSRNGDVGPGCIGLRCPRCGAPYVVCPVQRAA
jgi:hypothetical protein